MNTIRFASHLGRIRRFASMFFMLRKVSCWHYSDERVFTLPSGLSQADI